MKIVSLPEIKTAFDFEEAVSSIKDAFIAFSKGEVTTPPVGYLGFQNPPGDMHIKYGHIEGDGVFVIKIATGFYDNPKLSLPSSNGMMLVISAKTGEPLALLQDEGYLTDMRTAIAGAISSYALAPNAPARVGIVGTGIQARLQLQSLSKLMPIEQAYVWGRSESAVAGYTQDLNKQGIDVIALPTPEELCRASNIIVTTTPSMKPIIDASWVRAGTHITAVGADAPGKQELDAAILEKASLTICDSMEQCLHHGEMSHVPKGTFTPKNSMELGALLKDTGAYQRPSEAITVADLTGIAAQDIAISKCIWNAINV